MSTIQTRVVDTSRGIPADGMPVALEKYDMDSGWKHLGGGTTNDDGLIPDLFPNAHTIEQGTYRLTFDTGTYFAANGVDTLLPNIRIVFELREPRASYTIPLALSPYGYTTSIMS